MEWLENVQPKSAALANLITTVIAVGGMVWSAASINSSVNQLETFRDRARMEHQHLQQVQTNQGQILRELQTRQDALHNNVERLRDLHGREDHSGDADLGSGSSSARGAGAEVVPQPPAGEDEQEGRRADREDRSAVRDHARPQRDDQS